MRFGESWSQVLSTEKPTAHTDAGIGPVSHLRALMADVLPAELLH
jgi:hypothetical protein